MINIGKKGTIHFSNEETSLVLFLEDEELYFLYIGRKLGPDVETYLESLYLGKKRMEGSLLSGMCRNPFHFKVKDTRKINGLTWSKSGNFSLHLGRFVNDSWNGRKFYRLY